jgi:NAD(P)-dependent dehydrogenase (short-subunit alcohol dehydrogenase family)
MAPIEASNLLRPGLLEGVSVLVAGASADQADSFQAAVGSACAELGAHVADCRRLCDRSDLADNAASEEAAADDAVKTALADVGHLDLLVIDCAGLFALPPTCGGVEGEGARVALRRCLDGTWNVTRAVVNLAFLSGQRGGRILYLAPAPGTGEHGDAARAGLENLARTLSIEWARHSITVVAIAPGETTKASEVAALSAYLASPAGGYFSGCLMDLRGSAAT